MFLYDSARDESLAQNLSTKMIVHFYSLCHFFYSCFRNRWFVVTLPLVVSYYTKNTPYEKEVQYLIQSCKQFDIEYLIEGIEDKGSWEGNCSFKPYFIREKMKECKRPLMWVDADAVFLKAIKKESFMQADLSAFYDIRRSDRSLYDLFIFEGVDKESSIKSVYQTIASLNAARFSVRSGTVYVNSTSGGVKSLDLWCEYSDLIIKRQEKASHYSDGISLYCTFLSGQIEAVTMPASYCKIFDKKEDGLLTDEVVIEHHQASRRFVSNLSSDSIWI